MPADADHPDLSELRAALVKMCGNYHPLVIASRKGIANMPRQWVLENIEAVGRSALDFPEGEWAAWDFARFLEVLKLIGAHDLLGRMVREYLTSERADMREVAVDWLNDADPPAGSPADAVDRAGG